MNELNISSFKIENAKDGIIDDKILKRKSVTFVRDRNVPNTRLDAIFFVTLGYNSNLLEQISSSIKFTDNIVLLTTNQTTLTDLLLERGVEIIYFSGAIHSDIFSFPSSHNPSGRYNATFDIPSKRNYAINISREREYKLVGVFDDDVIITDSFLQKGSSVIANNADIAAGYSLSYPDISTIDVIRHRHRKERPSVTISGNSMFLRVDGVSGHFPYVYNEDWIFFVCNKKRGAKIYGFSEIKHLYKEKNVMDRVKFEQFGEIIAKSIADDSVMHEDFLSESIRHWDKIYKKYKDLLYCLIEEITKSHPDIVVVNSALDAIKLFSGADLKLFSQQYNAEVAE